MRQQFNIPRLFFEILGAIAVAEVGVMFILPIVAPGVEGAVEAVLDASMLSIMAGPVIVWRLLNALHRSKTDVDFETAKSKPWRHIAGAIGVLAIGIAATVTMVVTTNKEVHHEANTRFEQLTERLVGAAQRRVNQPRIGLSGARGIYVTSKSVERAEFAAYVDSRDLGNEFPGAIGFGVIERVVREDLDAFIATQRADEWPDFTMKSLAKTGSPLEYAPDLYLVKHCYPKDRNVKAWGLDVGSESVRREAVERAVASGQPTITGKITLVQDGNKLAGFLYLVPVYKNGSISNTPEERLAALDVLVYAPIILDEAMISVAETAHGEIEFKIFDGEKPTKNAQFYDSDKRLDDVQESVIASNFAEPMFKKITPVSVGGHSWTFVTSTTPKFDAGIDRSMVILQGVGGAILSLLLAGVVWTLGTGRSRAMTLAKDMTADLTAAVRETGDLRSTIDQHSMVSVTDAQGRIIQVNDKFCAACGYTGEELLGKDHHVLNSGTHPKTFWTEVWRALVSGKPWHGEVCNRAKDGSLYWVDSIISPFVGAGGKIEKYVSIQTTITDRKQAGVKLARMSEMLERTGELAQVGGWSLDLSNMKLSWTLQTYRIAEIDPSIEPDLENGINLFAPEAQPVVAAAVQEAIDNGTPYDLEVPLITAKGQHRWVKTQGYAEMCNGKAIRLYGTFQDISTRKQAEEELVQNEARFRTLVEGADVILWELDLSTDSFTYVSPQAIKLGYPMEAWLTKGFWAEHIHPDDREQAVSDCKAGVATNKDYRLSYRMLTADGSYIWIDDVATIEVREGMTPLIRGVLVDISERMQSQELLKTAQAKADDANMAKSAFLANMSHEIRTPLTAILGFTDLLRVDGDIHLAPKKRALAIDTISNAGNHLLTLINDILDLSKIEADKMTIECIDTPLITLLHEVESLMRPKSIEKGLALSTTLVTPVPEHILSDPTRLRQILMNMIGNAVKFTEAGSISIDVSVSVRDGQQRLLIDIEDTGTGMSNEQAARLFQAFGQADETMTRKFGGSGLGLTICHRFAALMDGDVKLLRTEPGKGSCFRLVLPLVASPGTLMVTKFDLVNSSSTDVASAVTPKLSGRILLAEDGIDNQRLIAFHLKKSGAELEIADNGKVALEMINEAEANGIPFDLLLTDMQMPEMDGYTLARTLRDCGSALPIVAITAHAMSDDRAKCIDAGCDDYTTKPINKKRLLATCATWMGNASKDGKREAA